MIAVLVDFNFSGMILILICLVILTIDPARKLYQEYLNWEHRQRLHEKHQRKHHVEKR